MAKRFTEKHAFVHPEGDAYVVWNGREPMYYDDLEDLLFEHQVLSITKLP